VRAGHTPIGPKQLEDQGAGFKRLAKSLEMAPASTDHPLFWLEFPTKDRLFRILPFTFMEAKTESRGSCVMQVHQVITWPRIFRHGTWVGVVDVLLDTDGAESDRGRV
jgi:hypothetical protein